LKDGYGGIAKVGLADERLFRSIFFSLQVISGADREVDAVLPEWQRCWPEHLGLYCLGAWYSHKGVPEKS
jgi:hypothetical protein